ncbi:hypothetical protein B7P43_G14985 [Cryptotermes secundus]|uniref:Uncharacterized protein n=1 Tax=Cryptotermes secundus TaxID=105785 RepID=A0A2J7RJA2_9NEOP|nr:hypothetical protein B7P43_G14985 [Cryptotermes secundus]
MAIKERRLGKACRSYLVCRCSRHTCAFSIDSYVISSAEGTNLIVNDTKQGFR